MRTPRTIIPLPPRMCANVNAKVTLVSRNVDRVATGSAIIHRATAMLIRPAASRTSLRAFQNRSRPWGSRRILSHWSPAKRRSVASPVGVRDKGRFAFRSSLSYAPSHRWLAFRKRQRLRDYCAPAYCWSRSWTSTASFVIINARWSIGTNAHRLRRAAGRDCLQPSMPSRSPKCAARSVATILLHGRAQAEG